MKVLSIREGDALLVRADQELDEEEVQTLSSDVKNMVKELGMEGKVQIRLVQNVDFDIIRKGE